MINTKKLEQIVFLLNDIELKCQKLTMQAQLLGYAVTHLKQDIGELEDEGTCCGGCDAPSGSDPV